MNIKNKKSVSPYNQSIETITEQLSTNTTRGLDQQEAEDRLKIYGKNRLPEKKAESIFFVFLRQFKDPLIYLLLISATIIFFLGEHVDAFVISGVLFFNAILGTIQEGRARSILASLKKYITTDAVIIRNGKKHIIPSTQLVPGDIIELETGEKVPADARVIESLNLHVDESMLTGETMGIEKITVPLDTNFDLALHDQKNMIFSGTNVVSGAGRAIVTATGSSTAIGTLDVTVEEIQTEMPLAKELDRLSHWILFSIFCMCLGLFVFGLYLGKPFTELLVILTALFICVIPEGLPVVFTLALVTGAQRLAKKNVLVKRMQAVEGLARTDIIVVDKTGTLTRNEMFVSQIDTTNDSYTVSGQGYKPEGEIYNNGHNVNINNIADLKNIAIAAALLNRAEIEYIPDQDIFKIKGDPTEAALGIFAQKCSLEKESLLKKYKPIAQLPFNTTLRYQAGAYEYENQGIIFVIGSPEIILSSKENSSLNKKLSVLLQKGLRVVAVGMTPFSLNELPYQKNLENLVHKKINETIIPLGILGIEDTVRLEVKESMQTTRAAGIKTVMATGDHKDTALYIAQNTGIYEPGDFTIDGSRLMNMPQEEFLKILPRVTVFSRVTPEEKLRIINAYHQLGNIVAMTGDGVNDAPSLAAADLGIAMGKIGTEVAKDAADMILLDDSFSNIIDAIKEGRHIFNALKRAILYFFTTNTGEVLVILFAMVLNYPLPLLAPQILWINLITDGFLDAALTMEPQEKDILQKHPSNGRSLININTFLKMLYLSTPMAAVSFAVFIYYLNGEIQHARTMGMVTLIMFQWLNAWNCRSTHLSIFQTGIFSNPWLILATLFVFGLQLILLHVPFFQAIFKTVPLTFHEWLLIFALSSPIILIEELRKLIIRRWYY